MPIVVPPYVRGALLAVMCLLHAPDASAAGSEGLPSSDTTGPGIASPPPAAVTAPPQPRQPGSSPAQPAPPPAPAAIPTGPEPTASNAAAEQPRHTQEWCQDKTRELVAWDPEHFPLGVIGWVDASLGDVEIELCGGARKVASKGMPIMLGDCFKTGAKGVVAIRMNDEHWHEYDSRIRSRRPSRITMSRNSELCLSNWLPLEQHKQAGLSGPRISADIVRAVDLVNGFIRMITSGWTRNPGVSIKAAVTIARIGGVAGPSQTDAGDKIALAYKTPAAQAQPLTDVAITHDAARKRTTVLVKQGEAGLTTSAAGAPTRVTAGQRVTIVDGRIEPAEALSEDTWSNLLSQHAADKDISNDMSEGDAAEGAGADGSRAPVTPFLGPLRDRYATLQALAEQLDQLAKSEKLEGMDNCKRDPVLDAMILGKNLYLESKAFADLLKDFNKAQTRHGLTEELGLISRSTDLIDAMLDQYYGMKTVTRPPLSDKDKDRVRKTLRKLALDMLRDRIGEKLKSEGLRVLLNSQSWNELLDNAAVQVDRKLAETIDRETERIFGMSFHDSQSLQRALRRRVRRVVHRNVAKLLVKITSNELVIEFVGGIVVRWLEGEIWPKIRESLRPKGNLEQRTTRSVATMEEAIGLLQALKPDARLDLVEGQIERASATLYAARYLEKDITRARDTVQLERLSAGVGRLSRWINRTRERFLLSVEKASEELIRSQVVLDDALFDLKLVTGRNPDDSAGPPAASFIIEVSGSGYNPHWAGGSHEVTGSDRVVLKLSRGEDLEAKLSAFMASLVPNICEIRNPGGMIVPEARPGIWESGPEVTVVCGPYFDRDRIDKALLTKAWKHLRDNAPPLQELKKRAGCG